jgi:hypothetical protein
LILRFLVGLGAVAVIAAHVWPYALKQPLMHLLPFGLK